MSENSQADEERAVRESMAIGAGFKGSGAFAAFAPILIPAGPIGWLGLAAVTAGGAALGAFAGLIVATIAAEKNKEE